MMGITISSMDFDSHPVRLKEGCPDFSGKMRWQDPHGVNDLFV